MKPSHMRTAGQSASRAAPPFSPTHPFPSTRKNCLRSSTKSSPVTNGKRKGRIRMRASCRHPVRLIRRRLPMAPLKPIRSGLHRSPSNGLNRASGSPYGIYGLLRTATHSSATKRTGSMQWRKRFAWYPKAAFWSKGIRHRSAGLKAKRNCRCGGRKKSLTK